MTRALVVYGTTYGGAGRVAAALGAALLARGLDTEVSPVRQVGGVAPFDAVVVAGALRGGRWARDARRLVHQGRDLLARMPVWLVAADPEVSAATAHRLAPVAQLAEMAALVDARGVVTVGVPFPAGPGAFGSLADAVVAAVPLGKLRAVPAWGSGGASAGRERARLRLVRTASDAPATNVAM
ncbi:flavodoxin domain-containing protein [Frankia canadensis]|uniref:flavodoxin domain-containing protein n=1 Tax=Frankia canadensis TaxID=1836972 RepID=UPI000C7C9531|nr:flavodoxin domain-containing protein [Frankia canadensis]